MHDLYSRDNRWQPMSYLEIKAYISHVRAMFTLMLQLMSNSTANLPNIAIRCSPRWCTTSRLKGVRTNQPLEYYQTVRPTFSIAVMMWRHRHVTVCDVMSGRAVEDAIKTSQLGARRLLERNHRVTLSGSPDRWVLSVCARIPPVTTCYYVLFIPSTLCQASRHSIATSCCYNAVENLYNKQCSWGPYVKKLD